MIISASYKTDLPALYGPWFMRRLEAGFCRMVNPYGGQIHEVDLRPRAVDGFVFWTKNLGPFRDALAEVRRRGYPFVVHYGINGYPRVLEPAVCDAEHAVAHVCEVADRYGPRVAVWRYDPILFTSLTPPAFHAENFGKLAATLAGAVDEVVISFAHVYRKTQRNVARAAAAAGFTWEDPDGETKRALARALTDIAASHGIRLTVCSQQRYVVPGAGEARCVDAARLADVAGHPVRAPLKGNRPDCRCHRSRDIGDYDTCTQGCVYCYAVSSTEAAARRRCDHDPDGEFLFAPAPRG